LLAAFCKASSVNSIVSTPCLDLLKYGEAHNLAINGMFFSVISGNKIKSLRLIVPSNFNSSNNVNSLIKFSTFTL
jgi:hypothetical protein